MYCPNCKRNFEDIDFCPCCVDDNGDSIKLIPTPNAADVSDAEINLEQSSSDPKVSNTKVEAINIAEDESSEGTDVADAEVEAVEIKEEQPSGEAEIAETESKEISEPQPQAIEQNLLLEVQQQLHQEMGLEPGWMSDVKNFCVSKDDGSCEEGYRLAYEDMRKKFGRKLWIEVDKFGKVTRVITTK